MSVEAVRVAEWPRPKGYENGMIGEGRFLFVAGQVGWDAEGRFPSDDLIDQFDRALENVLAVVRAAGGTPEDVVRMTVYVTDVVAYREGTSRLGPVWRARMGRHFPAMALVGVAALVEVGAKVEIEATACLGARGGA